MYSEEVQKLVNEGWKVLNTFKIADDDLEGTVIGINSTEIKTNGFPTSYELLERFKREHKEVRLEQAYSRVTQQPLPSEYRTVYVRD